MIEFFNTVMGKRFYEGTMPRIAEALEKLSSMPKQEIILYDGVEAMVQDATEKLANGYRIKIIEKYNSGSVVVYEKL